MKASRSSGVISTIKKYMARNKTIKQAIVNHPGRVQTLIRLGREAEEGASPRVAWKIPDMNFDRDAREHTQQSVLLHDEYDDDE